MIQSIQKGSAQHTKLPQIFLALWGPTKRDCLLSKANVMCCRLLVIQPRWGTTELVGHTTTFGSQKVSFVSLARCSLCHWKHCFNQSGRLLVMPSHSLLFNLLSMWMLSESVDGSSRNATKGKSTDRDHSMCCDKLNPALMAWLGWDTNRTNVDLVSWNFLKRNTLQQQGRRIASLEPKFHRGVQFPDWNTLWSAQKMLHL